MDNILLTDKRFYEIEDLPGEIWKSDTNKLNKEYLFSNYGRIKSMKKEIPVILKQCLDNRGYPRIRIFYRNKLQSTRVHQIIANVFLIEGKNCGEILTVDHIDNDPTNNRLENLRIITREQNTKRAHVKTVRLTNLETSKYYDFESLTSCANYLGKSHGYVGKVASGIYKQPIGWKIERLEINVDEILGIK